MAIKYRQLKRWLQEQAQKADDIRDISEIRQGGDPALSIEDARGTVHTIRLGNHAGFKDDVPKDALQGIADIFGKDRHWLEERIKGVPE
ncbi:MAG: hypothetical protein IJ682_13435 [Lachnospiraceae bacterium]|nr:hypothetical protein [Lachnospiraceae bacterium]